MKPYPAYKDSGIEWIGGIPEHWDIRPLKHLLLGGNAGIKIGPFGSSLKLNVLKEDGVKVYGQENVINSDFSLGNRFIDDTKFEELKVYEIFEEDILITMMGTTGKSKVVPANIKKGIMDSHLIRIRNKASVNPHFISLLINDSNYIFSQIKQNSKGSIMEGLNSSIIKSLLVLCPPIIEQHGIMDFLNHKTSQIDTLIEKKQKQIELLKEERTAIINHAVTKGLNPDVPMKDSGIEWLGEVPEHWEKMRLKYAFVLMRGFDLSSDCFVEGLYPVRGSNGIIGYHNEYTTRGPSVTVGRSGSVGEVNYIESDFWAHNTSLYIKIFKKTCPKFSYYLLKALNLKGLSSGSAVGTLNRNYIHDLQIFIPKCSEQKDIVSFLDCDTERSDMLIEKIRGSITLLQEYRIALISNAVTGKIDVRDYHGNST